MKKFKISFLFLIFCYLLSSFSVIAESKQQKKSTLADQYLGHPPIIQTPDPSTENVEELTESLTQSNIMLITQYHVKYIFKVDIAKSKQDKILGLSGRPSLPKDEAMLFYFDKPKIVSMWMKDTIFPIDMLFIAENGRIVKIHRRAVPFSVTEISSETPVVAVLEINGGLADEYRLNIGDLVLHKLLF